jgi:hypothetical protein
MIKQARHIVEAVDRRLSWPSALVYPPEDFQFRTLRLFDRILPSRRKSGALGL